MAETISITIKTRWVAAQGEGEECSACKEDCWGKVSSLETSIRDGEWHSSLMVVCGNCIDVGKLTNEGNNQSNPNIPRECDGNSAHKPFVENSIPRPRPPSGGLTEELEKYCRCATKPCDGLLTANGCDSIKQGGQVNV